MLRWKIQVSEGLLALYTDNPGKTKEQSLEKFECHNKTSISRFASGDMKPSVGNRGQTARIQKESIHKRKMYCFMIVLRICIFNYKMVSSLSFPEDVHAPMIGNDMIKS